MKNIIFFNIFDHNGNEKNLNGSKYKPLILFIVIVIAYFIFQIFTQPKFMLNGEMWAEMATNYYPNSNSPSLLTKLFATDVGYIPFPQRLIALIASSLNFPAISIPYYYTWSATILTAMLVGTFCLRPFRKIIPNDYLRLLTCFIILLSVDFETRTFINFTYFSGFFIAIITALALSDTSEEVPQWSWFIPILIISKPAVMAALPAMIIVAFVRESRFRLITIISFIVCTLQIIRLLVSSSMGILPERDETISFFEKILAGIQYIVGFLGSIVMGPNLKEMGIPIYLLGIMILALCLFLILFSKNNSKFLIFVGMSLLFFSVLLNTFALSKIWNLDMHMLNGFLINRHIIIGFHGIVLIILGMILSLVNYLPDQKHRMISSLVSFLLLFTWFSGSGLFTHANKLSHEPGTFVNNSQWINMANAIDADINPLCVPINPWDKNQNWMYTRNCRLFNSSPAWEYGSVQVNTNSSVSIPLLTAKDKNNLVSAAVVVKPLSLGPLFMEVTMSLELTDGQILSFVGSKNVDTTGGLIMMTGLKSVPIRNIKSASLTFNSPAYIARNANESPFTPGVAWMGN